jgi:undecaprenyl-diphosphatase
MKTYCILLLCFLSVGLLSANPTIVPNDNLDNKLYNTIRNDWQSPTMDNIMKATEHGSGLGGLALGNLAVFYFGGEKERQTAKLATTSWAGAATTTLLLKAIINRERPENHNHSRWNSSFPSGHTANWFALATVYSAKYPNLTIPLYGSGILVGISRIYLGEHYPSDVLAGAVLGVGFGYLTLKLEKQLKKIPFF